MFILSPKISRYWSYWGIMFSLPLFLTVLLSWFFYCSPLLLELNRRHILILVQAAFNLYFIYLFCLTFLCRPLLVQIVLDWNWFPFHVKSGSSFSICLYFPCYLTYTCLASFITFFRDVAVISMNLAHIFLIYSVSFMYSLNISNDGQVVL